jgi:outer membrane immunogenic protein
LHSNRWFGVAKQIVTILLSHIRNTARLKTMISNFNSRMQLSFIFVNLYASSTAIDNIEVKAKSRSFNNKNQGILKMKNVTIAAAIAASMLASPVLAQEVGDFSGVKGTAIAGYDNIDLDIAGVDNVDGFLYGAALGYDIQSGNFVYGAELEATESTGNISDATGRIEAGRDLYAGARIGYVVGSSALLYAKAGYTNARVSSPGVVSENGDGVRVGAGIEYKLSNNAFLRGEYRYSNYEAGVSRNQVVGGVGFRF